MERAEFMMPIGKRKTTSRSDQDTRKKRGTAIKSQDGHELRSSLSILSSDELDCILSRLRLSDLHSLRLSAIVRPGDEPYAQLKDTFMRRVDDLNHLGTLMDHSHVRTTFGHNLPPGWAIADQYGLGGFDYIPPIRLRFFGHFHTRCTRRPGRPPVCVGGWQFPLTPTEIVRNVKYISLREITVRGARTIVQEFPDLLSLYIHPKDDNVPTNNSASHEEGKEGNPLGVSDKVFSIIGGLTKLVFLGFVRQNIMSLPSCLFRNLEHLREFEVWDNPQPFTLPADIGTWLPALCIFSIRGSRLEDVPDSLVHQLVEKQRYPETDMNGFHVSEATMPDEVWERILSADRFQEAASELEDFAQAGHGWWDGTIVHKIY